MQRSVERDAVCWSDEQSVTAQPSAAAVCIWAGGFVGSPLLGQAGLRVNALGQACVDAQLRSLSHPHISVVGDAAPLEGRVAGPLQLSCKVALPMARMSRGRSGALLEELVCRYTVLRLRAERSRVWPLSPLELAGQATTAELPRIHAGSRVRLRSSCRSATRRFA